MILNCCDCKKEIPVSTYIGSLNIPVLCLDCSRKERRPTPVKVQTAAPEGRPCIRCGCLHDPREQQMSLCRCGFSLGDLFERLKTAEARIAKDAVMIRGLQDIMAAYEEKDPEVRDLALYGLIETLKLKMVMPTEEDRREAAALIAPVARPKITGCPYG